jgi:hypothetical protein
VILDNLRAVASWVSHASGLEIPAEGVELEESVNKQGQITYRAKLIFRGSLALPQQSRQRIKFDLTHHELIGETPAERPVFHPYSDAPERVRPVRCYALEEILAEKTRALFQRAGRARDIFDVVNISRNFRQLVDVRRARELAARKFAFKELPSPTPDGILAVIDRGVLAVDWSHALRHQIRVLPPVDEFLSALGDALRWLLLPTHPIENPPEVPSKIGETRVRALTYADFGLRSGGSLMRPASLHAGFTGSKMDRIRFSARNRLLARIEYHGVNRVVEPYSLRLPETGNLLLYAHEVKRAERSTGTIKAFKVAELGQVAVTDQVFRPRYLIEL